MSRKRRPFIEPRRPVFIGCEGKSEGGYGSFLAGLAEEVGLRVHLQIEELAPGAGDPLARVERAAARIEHLRKRRGAFVEKFILLDADQRDQNPNRATQATTLAAHLGIELVWQEPCHEALLLRHLPGRAMARPPSAQTAHQALMVDWPDYAKPMSRLDLSRRLDFSAVRRAAAVEPGLAGLLRAIGFVLDGD